VSFHFCRCDRGAHREWHLRYPGLTEEEAQQIANMINDGVLELYSELLTRKEAAAKARTLSGPTNPAPKPASRDPLMDEQVPHWINRP